MTINCTNINLKKGSSNATVNELQTELKKQGFYTGKIDGSYGDLTVAAVKSFQRKNSLLQDGIFGPVSCKKLNSIIMGDSGDYTGKYISKNHHEGSGCNRRGQCNSRCCGPHSIRQSNSKKDIDAYLESQLSSWAGTTSAGTSHNGIETAIAEVARRTGRKIKVQWKNFSDMGKTVDERFKAIGKLIEKQNCSIIWHNLYRLKYGHYEIVKEINMNNKTLTVINSLGDSCGNGTYCGYLETRNFSTMVSYLNGISQKSLCIITYE